MKRFFKKGLLLTLSCALLTALFSQSVSGETRDRAIDIAYFYMSDCASCDAEGVFIDRLNHALREAGTGADIRLSMYNAMNEGGYEKLLEYCGERHIPEDRITSQMLFVGGRCLFGDAGIDRELVSVLSLYRAG